MTKSKLISATFLRDLANLPTAYFALVMATGIVKTGNFSGTVRRRYQRPCKKSGLSNLCGRKRRMAAHHCIHPVSFDSCNSADRPSSICQRSPVVFCIGHVPLRMYVVYHHHHHHAHRISNVVFLKCGRRSLHPPTGLTWER